MHISPSLVRNSLKKIQASLSTISSTLFLSLLHLSSLWRDYVKQQIMFVAPVHIPEDVEGDLVVFIIFNCDLFLGYTILWAHIALSKDIFRNVELKNHQRTCIIIKSCISGMQIHVLIFWIDIISITISFFSWIYSQTWNPSTLIPNLFSQYV